jgi:hypothetical protein
MRSHVGAHERRRRGVRHPPMDGRARDRPRTAGNRVRILGGRRERQAALLERRPRLDRWPLVRTIQRPNQLRVDRACDRGRRDRCFERRRPHRGLLRASAHSALGESAALEARLVSRPLVAREHWTRMEFAADVVSLGRQHLDRRRGATVRRRVELTTAAWRERCGAWSARGCVLRQRPGRIVTGLERLVSP